MKVVSGNYTNGRVSLTRQTALTSPGPNTFDAIGFNTAAANSTAYSYLGGTASGTSILNSNLTGTIAGAATGYFAMTVLDPCGTTTKTTAAATPIISSITTTSAVVTFSSSASSVVEYGLHGFSPVGTGNTAGSGSSTVIYPATSPQTITGLTASALYDVYVRNYCASGDVNSTVVTFLTASPGGVAGAKIWLRADDLIQVKAPVGASSFIMG